MSAKTYRIKIVRADQQFEVEGDKNFVTQMLKRFEQGGRLSSSKPLGNSSKPPKSSANLQLASVKELSPGEFIRQFQFKKHTDFVLAFGFYLERHSDLSNFTAADINNCYYEAKMESSNTSQMIVQNIRRSFMMEAKKAGKSESSRRRYTLTQSGEHYLEKALAKGADD